MRVKHASVQTARMGIEAILADVVELSDRDYRAILEVSGTPRPFEDDTRVEGLLAGFGTFLNGLNFPIQIIVRASPVDLSAYLATLEERGRQLQDGPLAELAHDHATFIQRLARQRTLLERRFYVVVPAESISRASWWGHFRSSQREMIEEPRREAAQRQLRFRCEDVARQLARCGLDVRRLGDLELAQLFLACWSPERARVQRFRQQLDDYTTLAVRAARTAQAVN